MHIISQLRLSTFNGGKTFNAEVKIGDKFYGVTPDAVRVLIAEHKRLGGIITRFPARPVVVKNAARAAAYGRKVGDTVSVTDYATKMIAFDCTVGDGIIDAVQNVSLVTLTIDGGSLDFGEVKEVTTVAPKATVATPADDDVV